LPEEEFAGPSDAKPAVPPGPRDSRDSAPSPSTVLTSFEGKIDRRGHLRRAGGSAHHAGSRWALGATHTQRHQRLCRHRRAAGRIDREVRAFVASDEFADLWTRVNTRAQQVAGGAGVVDRAPAVRRPTSLAQGLNSEMGIHSVPFSVDDMNEALEIAPSHACHPLCGVATSGDVCRITYMRGPQAPSSCVPRSWKS
jgi:hypothetical protein